MICNHKNTTMTTLLHTTKGVSPVHEVVERQMDEQAGKDKFLRWEALREQVLTIGAHDALEQALRQHNAGGAS